MAITNEGMIKYAMIMSYCTQIGLGVEHDDAVEAVLSTLSLEYGWQPHNADRAYCKRYVTTVLREANIMPNVPDIAY